MGNWEYDDSNEQQVSGLRDSMIANDYKMGIAWKDRFFKKKFYEKLDELLAINNLEIFEDINRANS